MIDKIIGYSFVFTVVAICAGIAAMAITLLIKAFYFHVFDVAVTTNFLKIFFYSCWTVFTGIVMLYISSK